MKLLKTSTSEKHSSDSKMSITNNKSEDKVTFYSSRPENTSTKINIPPIIVLKTDSRRVAVKMISSIFENTFQAKARSVDKIFM